MIPDSSYHNKQHSGSSHASHPEGLLPKDNQIPVSYTHLDVYKRQVFTSFIILLYTFFILLDYEAIARGWIKPVSYTHLDVYKRQ